MSESLAPKCPACLENGEKEVLNSQGVVVTAAQALLQADWDTVMLAFRSFTPFDAHVAVTMYVAILSDLCDIFGEDIDEKLAEYRDWLHEHQSQT